MKKIPIGGDPGSNNVWNVELVPTSADMQKENERVLACPSLPASKTWQREG